MNNLEAVLKKFFGVLTKNYEGSNFNILEEISSDRDLFYNLKYCIEEEYVELFCNEIREFEWMEKYDNVVFNLVKLYPFTEKILKELMKNGNTSDNNEYYSIRKEELDKEIKGIAEKNDRNKKLLEEITEKEKKLDELEKKYTKDFYDKKEIELQQEEEKVVERKQEIQKLDEEIKKIREDEFRKLEKNSDIEGFIKIRNITRKIISKENRDEDEEEFKFSE